MKVHAIRLKPGQDLKREIQKFANEKKIEAGWIMTCVGSLAEVRLRYANQENEAVMSGYFEILSLSGTISIHGSHIHASMSDHTGKTIGGHLLDGNCIYTTAEIIIGETSTLRFTRKNDGTTEWPELQIDTR